MRKHKEMHNRLVAITDGCREDMHEPDEQGLTATISGNHLDNAFGSFPPDRNQKEFIVTLTRFGRVEHFNLADLIALARKA